MSLLEDIYLQDEADEAQELERVIEGDEYDERPRPSTPNSDENSEKEDEAEEDKRRVDPTKAKEKRVVRNPRLVLNPARLTGPRGIQIIPEHFKDFKFKGKGHEKDDLDLVLKRLEHWAYRLFPKFQFEDCLKKIETLGKKRPVMVHLHKIRTDQYTTEEAVVQRDSSDDEDQPVVQEEDEFDKLLQQQIDLARATPAPGSVKKGFETPKTDNRSLLMPKATSSPSISDEQKERMLRNRKLAEERRLAKLKQNSNDQTNQQESANIKLNNENKINKENREIDTQNDVDDFTVKKDRSNVIDSSDDDAEMTAVNKSITVDVHDRILHHDKVNDSKEIATDNELVENEHSTDISSKVNTELNAEVIDTADIQVDSQTINTEHTRKSPGNSIIEENDDINETNVQKSPKKDSIDNNNEKPVDSLVTSDSLSNTVDTKNVEDLCKNNGKAGNDVGDQLEDIMDVDFSEDF